MFSALPAIALATFAAADVWVATSAQRVFPDSRPPSDAPHEIHIALARDEYESFQVAVRTDTEELERVAVDVPTDPASPIAGPEIREVAYLRSGPPSDRAAGAAPLWPDPLVPYEPKSLALGQTRVFWLTFSARPDASPGIHTTAIAIDVGEKQPREIQVQFEVFDFAIPRTPSLAALYTLDRAPVRRAYGFESNDLLRWQAIYDALADYRIAFNLWNGENPNPADARAHLDYATAINPAPIVDLGPPQHASQIASDRAVVSANLPEVRAQWNPLRDGFAAVPEGVRRILTAPLHPFWENDLDVWAIPFEHYSRDGRRLLETGRSLAWAQGAPAIAAHASTAAEPTAARDAYDGSLFSHWSPHASDKSPQLTVELATPLTVETFLLAWMPGHAPGSVKFSTSRDAVNYTPATVSWTIENVEGPYGYVWWEGQLRVEKTFSAFRLEATPTPGRPLQLAEVSFELHPHYPPMRDMHTVQPWLAFNGAAFPSAALDAHIIDYRIRPWLCWTLDVEGFTGGGTTNWPIQFYTAALNLPDAWPPAPVKGTLIYPAPGRPLPSIRLMHLRDGMEDYEYLVTLTAMLQTANTEYDWLQTTVARNPALADTAQRQPADTLLELLQRRTEMGRAITALAAGNVPRDPKGFAR